MPTLYIDSGSFNNLQVTGSTILSGSGTVLRVIGSGSSIFVVSGSSGEIFKIEDPSAASTTLFTVISSSITILSVNEDKTVNISGSLIVTGSITGRLFGTSSWATNALTASYVNPLIQNVIITGSLVVSGSNATIELYGDKLIIGAVGGDEGGEILLGKPATSSSLTGSGITIDSYQNRLRFFEQGGDARGGFLEITSLGNGASTDLRIAQHLESQQAMGSTIKAYTIGCPFPTLATSGQTLSGGVGTYTAVYIHTTTTITGVKFQQFTQGNYIAANYNGVGLYSTSAGTLSLVASSSNDGNLWKGASNSFQSKSFASTYSAAPGIYYICALWSTSSPTTSPAISFAGSAASTTANLGVLDFTNSNKMNGTAGSGLTTLATSQAASGIAATQHRFAFYLF